MIRPDMEPIPARDAFLLVAAAVADGMPVPTEQRITDDFLFLDVPTLADGRRWLAWLGADMAEARDRACADNEGKPRVRLQHSALDQWQGRWVTVRATEAAPAPVESEAADKVRAAAAAVTA